MRKRAAAIALIAFAALFGPLRPVGASSPDRQGWWSSASIGVGGGLQPDVPAKGLLVQGGPSGPTAYAALVFHAAPSGGAKLTLNVHSRSISTPNAALAACPLRDATFEPAQGAPMSKAPAYDCTSSAPATAIDSAYQFDVTPLITGDALAVAIVPTGPADRVAFDEPDANSLVAAPSTGAASPDAGSVWSEPLADPSLSAGFDLPTPSASALAPAATTPAPVAAPKAVTATRPAAAVVPLPAPPEDANPAMVVGTLAALTLGAGLWLAAGRNLGSPKGERAHA